MASLIYIPKNSVQEFPFITTSLPTLMSFHFDDSHSNNCEVTSHCDFYLPEVFNFNEVLIFFWIVPLVVYLKSIAIVNVIQSFSYVFF